MSIAQRLLDAVEQDIAIGALPPGARLDEQALATRYKASRTPVREALRQLSASGMVEIRPRRGAFVSSLDPRMLYQSFEAMGELEAASGRLAARRSHPDHLAELASAHERCRAAMADPDAYYVENELFHQAIYKASGNVVLAQQCTQLQKRLRPYRRLQLRVANRVGRSFDEHQQILDAIRTGDGRAAEEALRSHVVVQGERFSDLIASLPMLQAA
jgi:DNA-binding GntR family transcriptional regulator